MMLSVISVLLISVLEKYSEKKEKYSDPVLMF